MYSTLENSGTLNLLFKLPRTTLENGPRPGMVLPLKETLDNIKQSCCQTSWKSENLLDRTKDYPRGDKDGYIEASVRSRVIPTVLQKLQYK